MSTIESLEKWSALPNSFRLIRWASKSSGSWRAELLTMNNTPLPDMTLWAERFEEDDRVVVSFSEPLHPRTAALAANSSDRAHEARDAVAAIDRSRSGILSCSIGNSNGTPTVEIACAIYGDGFTRHALNAGVQEILKTYLAIDQRLDDLTIAAQLHDAANSEAAMQSIGESE